MTANSVLYTVCAGLLTAVLTTPAAGGHQADSIRYVIHISVDGLRPDAVTVLGPERVPNFYRLRSEGVFTDDARTDGRFTNTLPNHASMLTGRHVVGSEGHGVIFNDLHPGTFETVTGSYLAGVFDVAHDRGLRTSLFYSKDKFIFYERSWNSEHGALDTVGVDNGRGKIDVAVFDEDTDRLTSVWVDSMRAAPFAYSFLAFRDPDSFGHAREWMGPDYLNAVEAIDGYLGRIFDLVESDSRLTGRTAMVLTSDHGGSGTGHGSPTNPDHFTIPLYVWGPGIEPTADLYQLNWATRRVHCRSQPSDLSETPPVRNGGSGNLALSLLGLPPIPGSTINTEQDLATTLPEGIVLPVVEITSPAPGERFSTGEPARFEAIASSDIAAVDRVLFQVGCDTVGNVTEPPFAIEWSGSPPGSFYVKASAYDDAGRFGTDTSPVTIEARVVVNGSDTDWTAIGVSPVTETDGLQEDPELALERLFFFEDSVSYYFGFDAPARTKRVTYGFYLDVDAARRRQMSDPLNYAVRMSNRHAPEIAFYFVFDPVNGWGPSSPRYFRYNRETSDEWIDPGWPDDFSFEADTTTAFVEFSFPKTLLNQSLFPGAEGIFAQLFTVGETPGAGASESIPSDPAVAFISENTSTETTILSNPHNFSFPQFGGDEIRIDGTRFDWLRSSTIEPIVNEQPVQTDPELVLEELYVTHDLDNFYFAFLVTTGPKKTSFGLYIDAGAFADPAIGAGDRGNALGHAVKTGGAFIPDVQIFFDNDSTGVWTPETPQYFVWDNLANRWSTVSQGDPVLPEHSQYDAGFLGVNSWVEFSIPRDAPGFYDSEVFEVELFSVGSTPGAGASATVPADPNVTFTEENTSLETTVLNSPFQYATQPIVVHSRPPETPPPSIRLLQAYPNPMSTAATIWFTVEHPQPIRITIYDMLGRRESIVLDRTVGEGEHRVPLDASGLATGVYLLRMERIDGMSTKKLVVVR